MIQATTCRIDALSPTLLNVHSVRCSTPESQTRLQSRRTVGKNLQRSQYLSPDSLSDPPAQTRLDPHADALHQDSDAPNLLLLYYGVTCYLSIRGNPTSIGAPVGLSN